MNGLGFNKCWRIPYNIRIIVITINCILTSIISALFLSFGICVVIVGDYYGYAFMGLCIWCLIGTIYGIR